MNDPAGVYRHERDLRQARIEVLDRRADRLASVRLVVFLAGIAMAWWLAGPAPWLLVIPLAGFVAAVVVHGRVRAERAEMMRALGFFERGLARLEDRWAGAGDAGQDLRDRSHPYAEHLDIFGTGSLFELLSTARTAGGRATLAAWLLELPRPDVTRSRAEAVAELRARWDLRESIARIESRFAEAAMSHEIEAWATRPVELPPAWLILAARWLPVVLAGAAVAAPWVGWGPALLVTAFEYGVARRLRAHTSAALDGLDRPVEQLRLMREVLPRIEDAATDVGYLAELRAAFGRGDHAASRQLSRLASLIDRLEWRGNQMFLPLSPLLLWGTNHAIAIERWRAVAGTHVPEWQQAIGEFEALLDLAGYAFERPSDPFPEVRDTGAFIVASDVRHPLLPRRVAVANDVRLGGDDPDLMLITGSNMSGKSTLLRAVGLTIVLARIGAPVPVRRLELGPVTPGASIRTVDSLADGASRFFAEVRSIRTAVQLAAERPPVLFLLDELLHGTNSHDRRIGAKAILQTLLDRDAIGIVTTHDLALAEIVDTLGERAANWHFEFRLRDGEIQFPYRLEPGVVRTGNALEIMRSVGLDV